MGNFEEEIRQHKFKEGPLKAMLNIMYTANWIRDNHSHIFKAYNILPQHYNIMRIVRGRHGEDVTPGEIIKVMIDKGRDLTRLVDKLVKIGYLERSQDKNNRRKVNILLTEKGLTVTDEIEVKISEWINSAIIMTKEETEIINNLLDKLRGAN
jgi:DNA-binding MarR family transcriptional regulator